MLQIGKNGNIEVKMKLPTIWKEPSGKEDCYFCNTNLHGVNSSNKSKINYANVTKPISILHLFLFSFFILFYFIYFYFIAYFTTI